MELFEQHDLDGDIPGCVNSGIAPFFMAKIAMFESAIEFVAIVNEHKDCLMAQDNTQDDPSVLWFNIDVPKGHGLKAGDRVRVTIEKI